MNSRARAVEVIEFVEIVHEDGTSTIEANLRGTHETESPDDPGSLAYAITLSCLALFTNGTIADFVKETYGISIDSVKLESKE